MKRIDKLLVLAFLFAPVLWAVGLGAAWVVGRLFPGGAW